MDARGKSCFFYKRKNKQEYTKFCFNTSYKLRCGVCRKVYLDASFDADDTNDETMDEGMIVFFVFLLSSYGADGRRDEVEKVDVVHHGAA